MPDCNGTSASDSGWYTVTSDTSTSNAIINCTVWSNWNTTVSGTTAWGAWNTEYVTIAIDGFEPVAPSPDIVAAEERAEALLRSFLTPAQEASYFDPDRRYFDLMVEGGDRPPRHYRIKHGVTGNIKRLENGREVESLCVHPTAMPVPDINLCQMLELSHREEEYRKIANITPIRGRVA